MKISIVKAIILFAVVGLSHAADYFVDPAGSDSNVGTSTASAWRSVDKVNATVFQPGDNVLFKRGGTWVGALRPQGSGTSTSRITLGAYGSGAKPLINGNGTAAAISLSTQDYWTIQDFEVINPASGDGNRSGIRVDYSGSGVMRGIQILNNDVRDVRGIKNVNDGARNNGGIFFWINEPGKADGVLIQGNTVKNIYGQGIAFNAEAEYAGGGMNYANCSPNVIARGNTVVTTSGDGILMLGTDNELVEYNEVAYVGQLSDTGNNIAAAWPTRHINGVWQYNHVHHTAALSANDSTAFDNDGYVQGTTIFQYNHSHDNGGGFIMEYKWDRSGADTGNTTVRYNISVNDSRVVASNRGGMDFYNNVIYAPGATLDVQWTDTSHRVNFRNNIFWALARSTELTAQTFSYNTFNGGITRPTSSNQNRTRDPLFVSPNTSGNLAGFILQSSSPERNVGVALPGNGGKDFWGASVPASPTAPSRGASQIASVSNYSAASTFVQLTGVSELPIPTSGTSTTTFVATVRDQNFRRMTNPAVTWSIVPEVSGCSIDSNGTITVAATASPQRLAIQATSGSATTMLSLALTQVPNYLLSDNFDSPSYGASTFNNTLSADQSGQLAPLSYSVSTAGQDWQAQHGNGSAMLLVGDYGYAARTSPNQNFATLANTANLPLTILVDAWVADTSNSSCWSSITIGSGQNLMANDSAAKFAFLPELGGGLQVVLNGSQAIRSTRSGNSFRLVLSDTAGTGSAFNGKGSIANLYNGSTLVGTYALTQLTASDGYLSFAACPYNGAWNITHIDNLLIGLGSNPSFGYSLTYKGNGNVSGSVPVDTKSPYISGATATVLGNTGNLARPGFVFSGWNTAADGSGTTYQPGDSLVISSNRSLYAMWTTPPDVIWNNGSNSRNWNTSDANWSGSAWNNTRWDRAIFGVTGAGVVTLTEAITARAIRFDAPGYVLNGSSLILVGAQTIICNANASINSSLDCSGLNKAGSGTLTLGGSTTYLGNLTVNEGRVALSNSLLDGCTTVSIAAGAGMDLNFNGSNAIAALSINGSNLPAGTYNAQHPVYGSYFSGSGSLRIYPMTYQLAGGHENWPAGMRATIVNSMNEAVAVYNAYGYFPMQCIANYNAGVPTAQAGYGGWIDFGGNYSAFTAIHEIQHSLGVGTYWAWSSTQSNGQWTGAHGSQRIRLYEGETASIGCDGAHFWPYGLNFDSEDGVVARERHVKLVAAMRWDMGIVADSDNDGLPDDWEMFHFGHLNATGADDVDADGFSNSIEYLSDTNPNLNLGASVSGLIFSDNFDSGSYGAASFNTTLTADQSGLLAPLSYSVRTAGQDWQTQHGNGNAMLLVGDSGYAARSSPNQNFATLANTTDLPLTVRMDAWVEGTSNPSCWASITLGSAQNLIANESGAKFAFLPELGGGLQVVLNGSQSIRSSRSGNNFRLVFSDTAGTGSAFNGKGSMAKLYNDSTLVGTYTLTQLTAADGYLSFSASPYNGAWNIARIDNLSVTLTAVAAPTDFEVWKTAHQLSGASSDDDDRDGLSNFMEYAFGLDPKNPASCQAIMGRVEPSTGIFSYTRRKIALTSLAYAVWTSDNLSDWTLDGTALQSVTDSAGDIETVRVTLSPSLRSHSKLFVRITTQ